MGKYPGQPVATLKPLKKVKDKRGRIIKEEYPMINKLKDWKDVLLGRGLKEFTDIKDKDGNPVTALNRRNALRKAANSYKKQV